MSFLETGILRLEDAFLRKGNSGSVAVEVLNQKCLFLVLLRICFLHLFLL